MQVLGPVATLEFVGEVDVCGFGLAVGDPGVVGVGLGEVVVVEADFAVAVAEAGD